jgi:hypothetical protein
MSRGDGLEPVSETLDAVFNRMDLPHPRVMAELNTDWESLAGQPWAGRSRPVVVKGKTLVVEAGQPSHVAFLKYGVGTLLTTLSDRFGEGVITTVEVVPPGRASTVFR